MTTATALPSAIQVQSGPDYAHDLGRYFLTIANPNNDFKGFKAAPEVVECNGMIFSKTCFNSDRGYISYRTGDPIAFPKKAKKAKI